MSTATQLTAQVYWLHRYRLIAIEVMDLESGGPRVSQPWESSQDAAAQPRYDSASQQTAPDAALTATADQLRGYYAGGARVFAQWNLAGVDLSNTQLADTNFFGADLRGANLSGADLSRANLGQANLSRATLAGVNLSDAFLDGADLTGADMADVIRDRPSPPVAAPPPPRFSMPPAPSMPLTAPAPVTSRFCIFCGTAMPANAAFCPNCGQTQPAMPAAPSVPLMTGQFAAQPSTPLSRPFAASPYGAPATTPFGAPAFPQVNVMGMMIATISGAIGTLAFFLPAYLGTSSAGVSGPQVASAFGTVSSACSQYSDLINNTPSAQGVCTFSGLAGPVLWLEALLLGVATGVAGWQWYTARQTGNPPEQGPARIVLICSGISLAILLFQFFVVPSMLASSTGVAFLSSAISSAFSYGFWLMVLGAAGAVFGAVRQSRL